MVSNDSNGHSGLLKLPSELVIGILEHLPARDIAQVQRTCHAMLDIARSDEVWRAKVEKLVRLHGRRQDLTSWTAQDGVYMRYVQGLLGISASYLGWWASTQPYRGRLVRVSLQMDPDGDLAVSGEEITCLNGFDNEQRFMDPCILAHRWKPQAAIWHGQGQLSYRMPSNHPSPDAGYSIDVLYPVLKHNPIFQYTRQDGFTLTAPADRSQDTRISLPISWNLRRKLNDTAGTTEQTPSRYSDEQQGPSFPSRNAVRGKMVRSLDAFGDGDSQSQIQLEGEYLTAPCFTIQATRRNDPDGQAASSTNGNSMDYIHQERDASNGYEQQDPAPVLLANPGGNHLFRAFLEGIGAILPPTVQDTLFGQHDDEDEQELFYPIRGPLHQVKHAMKSAPQPYPVLDLGGIWVGGYSTHGYEFGRIAVRNTWTRIHMADEVALEQIYDDESVEEGNADPSVSREAVMSSTVEGSMRRRRTIVEFIKITGDVNVPAGQVSWVAVLPSADDQQSQVSTNGYSQYQRSAQPEPDINTMSLPTINRSDWQTWSDLPPHTARHADIGISMPRWEEGTVRAAGRIAFTGFVDTRFIDAQATFVREDSGQVDEIRVKWHEMAKVSTFRRIKLD